MIVLIENQKINPEILVVPEMNFGQMQRWKGHTKIYYTIEMSKELFFEKIKQFFSEFRNAEIDDDDTFDLPELIAFKKAGWPTLNQLIKKHPSLLKDLIIFHEYEVLHLITIHTKTLKKYFYSANSIDEVIFEDKTVKLKGISFKVIFDI